MNAQSVLSQGSFEKDTTTHRTPKTNSADKLCPIMVRLGYDLKNCKCDLPEVRNHLEPGAACVSENNECKLVQVTSLTTKVSRYRQRKHTLRINRNRTGGPLTFRERKVYVQQVKHMETWFAEIAKVLSKHWLS